MSVEDTRVPVTVLTGFLGSGKTTLLNRILSEQHGKRIAVIENEYGEIGIDHELVIQSDEEIFEMNNGCICCTVRGDLIRILGRLMAQRDRFDYILVETTGLADPGPVAQTFFMDDEIREKLRLDAIVTVVDSRHVLQHLGDSQECQAQLALADIVLLNKTDLVSPSAVQALKARVRGMNAAARLYATEHARIGMDAILDVRAFDLGAKLEVQPRLLEPELPFEWAGVFALDEGAHEITCSAGPDPSMDVAVVALEEFGEDAFRDARDQAVLLFSDEPCMTPNGGRVLAGPRLYRLDLDAASQRFTLDVDRAGYYALFTQHLPSEFGLCLQRGDLVQTPLSESEYAATHEHDQSVSSVGITAQGDLDRDRFERWITNLLRFKGVDIYRMKGILSLRGDEKRFVFQGVHMLFDGEPDRPWGADPRVNQLVFIGRDLDHMAIRQGFQACLV